MHERQRGWGTTISLDIGVVIRLWSLAAGNDELLVEKIEAYRTKATPDV
jgi:hypothetical protein